MKHIFHLFATTANIKTKFRMLCLVFLLAMLPHSIANTGIPHKSAGPDTCTAANLTETHASTVHEKTAQHHNINPTDTECCFCTGCHCTGHLVFSATLHMRRRSTI